MDELAVKEYLNQGAVLAGQGKYPEAIAFYDKAEQANPMNFEIYLAKGIAFANMNQLDEAKLQFEKALKINRTSGLAYFHLGSIAILQEDIALGFENYNKAITNGFDDAQLYYSIGLLHEENGEIDLAIRNYTKAITQDALRPDIRIRKARLLIQGNHIPEALQVLDETILTNPDIFEGYHIKFVLLMQQNQHDKAEEVLKSALSLFPNDPSFLMDKASLLAEQNKTQEALNLLSDIEKFENIDNIIRRQIGMERSQIFAMKNDVLTTIKELEKTNTILDEFDVEIVFLLANCHMTAGEHEKVLEYARQIVEKSDIPFYKLTAQYYVPMALKMLGRMDEARPLYEEAISEFRNQALASPGNLDAYMLRAMCLRDLDQFDKALELIDYVITLQPESAEPRMLRVNLLETLNRDAEAKEETRIVNAMLPEEMRRQ